MQVEYYNGDVPVRVILGFMHKVQTLGWDEKTPLSNLRDVKLFYLRVATLVRCCQSFLIACHICHDVFVD